MIVIKHRNLLFAFTTLLIGLSLCAVFAYGLKSGIDFIGGSVTEATYAGERPDTEALTQAFRASQFSEVEVRSIEGNGYSVRTAPPTNAQRALVPQLMSMGGDNPATITKQNEIGPTIGKELRTKAFLALGLVLLSILLFVAYAFRHVSKPVSSWVYGIIALVTLMHDVIVPVGFFALLGHFTTASVDTLFVTAILTVLGFSVHDTIVVFDRVRENLRINAATGTKEPFAETAGHALSQTFVRSLNTSLTVVFTLLVLYFYGPSSTQYFALTLLVGIIAGTYSSIFVATPLLVEVANRRGTKETQKK